MERYLSFFKDGSTRKFHGKPFALLMLPSSIPQAELTFTDFLKPGPTKEIGNIERRSAGKSGCFPVVLVMYSTADKILSWFKR